MITVVTLATLFSGVARADEEAAETCLDQKVKEGYASGWQVRSQTNQTLASADHKVYLLTMYAGNEYKLLACGDTNVSNLDLVLYDNKGNVVKTDGTDDREPMLGFTPQLTDTYYLAVHASRLTDAAQKSGVSVAVTYK